METKIADLKKQLAEKKEERKPLVNSNIQNANTQQLPDLTAIMQWMTTQAASNNKENQPKQPKSKRIRNNLGNGEGSVRQFPTVTIIAIPVDLILVPTTYHVATKKLDMMTPQ